MGVGEVFVGFFGFVVVEGVVGFQLYDIDDVEGQGQVDIEYLGEILYDVFFVVVCDCV